MTADSIAQQLKWGAPHHPRVLTVEEYRTPLPITATRDQWWVVLVAHDGTRVEVPGDLIVDDASPGEPETCGDPDGCSHYVDLSRDDRRCVDHAVEGRRWP